MKQGREVYVWNRALGESAWHLAVGDRALAALLNAPGQVMNGGVLNTVEAMTRADRDEAIAGYRFFRLDGIGELFARAVEIVRAGSDIGSHEQSCDSEYRAMIPDDSFLFSVFEKQLHARPGDFAP